MIGAPVWHFVTFAAGVEPAIVKRVHDELLALKLSGEIFFDQLSIGIRTQRSVTDGRFHGRIRTSDNNGSSVLALGFPTLDALDIYYAAPTHAVVRRSCFAALSPEIADLYSRADADPDSAAELYEEIEHRASQFIKRDDFNFSQIDWGDDGGGSR
jgi:hypothetical protein